MSRRYLGILQGAKSKQSRSPRPRPRVIVQTKIPNQLQKQKGRDLCLYSTKEFPQFNTGTKDTSNTNDGVSSSKSKTKRKSRHEINDQKECISLDCDESDYGGIKKKYYCNMYIFAQWSEFIDYIFKNDTLDKFANKLEDGTYILGVPASSYAIEKALLAVSLPPKGRLNSSHLSMGNVNWVNFYNVIDALDIANFLQIKDLLTKSLTIIWDEYPILIGNQKQERFAGNIYNNNLFIEDEDDWDDNNIAHYSNSYDQSTSVVIEHEKSFPNTHKTNNCFNNNYRGNNYNNTSYYGAKIDRSYQSGVHEGNTWKVVMPKNKKNICTKTVYNRYNNNNTYWNSNEEKTKHYKNAKEFAEYLLKLIKYLNNINVDWAKIKYNSEKYIGALIVVFFDLPLTEINFEQKFQLFHKYISNEDYAYKLFFKLSTMVFASDGPSST